MNISFFKKQLRFSGPRGFLPVSDDDEVSRRLAMLIVGQCEGRGATQAARQFHFSRQRYYQLLAAFSANLNAPSFQVVMVLIAYNPTRYIH